MKLLHTSSCSQTRLQKCLKCSPKYPTESSLTRADALEPDLKSAADRVHCRICRICHICHICRICHICHICRICHISRICRICHIYRTCPVGELPSVPFARLPSAGRRFSAERSLPSAETFRKSFPAKCSSRIDVGDLQSAPFLAPVHRVGCRFSPERGLPCGEAAKGAPLQNALHQMSWGYCKVVLWRGWPRGGIFPGTQGAIWGRSQTFFTL